jgi:hypothetical protein
MQVIGSEECTVEYRYVSTKAVIDKQQVTASGAQETIKREFSFADAQSKTETLVFSDGKTSSHLVRNLEIEEQRLILTLWGSTTDALTALDKVVEILDASITGSKLSTMRKTIKPTTKFRVKLDIDPPRLFSEKFVSLLKELSPQFAAAADSNVEVHFPLIGAAWVSEPMLSRILKSDLKTTEEIAAEVNASSGTRVFSISTEKAAEYRAHEFGFMAECDSKEAERIVTRIEDIFRPP